MTDTTLNRYLASGDTAARTAFTPSPATPASGPDPEYLWYDTDDQTLYAWDFVTGPGWVATGAGGVTYATATEVLTGTEAAKVVSPDTLAAIWEQGADVASAATISLGEGGHFNITGTTDISDIDFATDKAGRLATLVFAGALTVTHGASLISYTGASLRTVAGTVMIVRSEGSDVVRILWSNSPSIETLRTIWPPFTRPSSTFAWINQGSATEVTDTNNTLYLVAPTNTGDSLRIRKESVPGTPYSLTIAIVAYLPSIAARIAGLVTRQSGDGKLYTLNIVGNTALTTTQVECDDWNSATSFSASNAAIDLIVGFGLIFLKYLDNGTNKITSFSIDGENFIQLFSETRTTFMTADEYGYFASTNTTASTAEVWLLSYKKGTT